MVALILALLVCVLVAGVVVAMVAIPARRQGRDLLTARGEDMLARGGDLVAGMKERGEAVVDKVTPGSSAEPTPAEPAPAEPTHTTTS